MNNEFILVNRFNPLNQQEKGRIIIVRTRDIESIVECRDGTEVLLYNGKSMYVNEEISDLYEQLTTNVTK